MMFSKETGVVPPGKIPSTPVEADAAWIEFTNRFPSDHRRHGDPFPLPRLGKPGGTTMLNRRLDGAFGALNSLASDFFDKTSDPDLTLTRVQLWMMDDLRRRVSNYGDKPKNLDMSTALHDLGCGANLYTQEANNVADFDVDQIKILSRQLDPKPAIELSPPDVQAILQDFGGRVERQVNELEALRASGTLVTPHWDPKLKKNFHMRLQLYQRLFRCGLLTYRRRQKAQVGMFTVVKKGNRPGNTQRLIVDCRQANMLQRRPPTTRLSTPASLADLDFSVHTLQENGYDIENLDDFVAGIETGDVGDCFYNFVIERACSWFSTGDVLTRADMRQYEMDVDSIYDDEMEDFTPLREGEQVFVCFRGVPMGWSWAFWLSNEIVCHQCLVATGGAEDSLVRDKRVAPKVLPGKPPIGVYVDNVHTFSGCSDDAHDQMVRIADRFQQLGIPFDMDNVSGNSCIETLGLTFFFQNGVRVRAKRERAWRLWLATKALLQRRRVSGDALRVWLGHVNYHFLLCRPLLSILSGCYSFCHAHIGHRFPLWPSVRKEMRQVMHLIFTVEKNLSSPICPEVHVGDSSDKGYGLLVSNPKVGCIKRELLVKERWRFLESCEPKLVVDNGGYAEPLDGDLGTDDYTIKGCSPGCGIGPTTGYGKQLADTYDTHVNTMAFKKKRNWLFGRPQQPDRSIIQIPGFPEVSDSWSEPTQWDLVTASAWQRPEEHINIKEGRVALMSLKRLCRTTKNLGTTALTLCDNMGVVLAMERGRSSSGSLNTLCRRAAAYCVGGGISWRLRYIRSAFNPADEPSRRFGEDYVRRGTRGGRADALGAHFSTDSLEQGQIPSQPRVFARHQRYTSDKLGFLELFAGTGNLSKAMQKAGLRVFPSFEISRDFMYDLLNPGAQHFVFSMLASGLVWYIHLGTPCTAWSRARHNIQNFRKARRKEHQAVATALFTCRVIQECLKRGISFSLENPFSSRLWQFGPLVELMKNKSIRFVTWDMCQYGMPYKKQTTIMTNEKALSMLERTCSKNHQHTQLRGSTRAKIDGQWKTINKTSLAGAYPPELCKEWARAASKVSPVQAIGDFQWRDRNEFLGALQEASGAFHQKDDGIFTGDYSKHGTNLKGRVSEDPTKEASKFIKQNPVVFGQFTKQQAEGEYRKHKVQEETQ